MVVRVGTDHWGFLPVVRRPDDRNRAGRTYWLSSLYCLVEYHINGALMFMIIGFITWPITVLYADNDAYRTAERINAGRGGHSSF